MRVAVDRVVRQGQQFELGHGGERFDYADGFFAEVKGSKRGERAKWSDVAYVISRNIQFFERGHAAERTIEELRAKLS